MVNELFINKSFMENDALPILLKWIHLMATVAWIGGMFTNFFIYIPAMGKALAPAEAGKLTARVMKRFRVMVYVSIALFLISGVIMASLHLNSGAVFSSKNHLIALLILKVPLYVLLVLLALLSFERMAPRLARMAEDGPSSKLHKAQKSQKLMGLASFLLGMIILLVSAAI